MENYLINENTIALIPLGYSTKVIEISDIFILNKRILKIINDSCKFYGSSYKGRVDGSNYLLGINYKTPIIISEYKEIIMFPTSSPVKDNCIWLCYNHINNYYMQNNEVIVNFKNKQNICINISSRIINNQILKSSRLESILKSKKR